MGALILSLLFTVTACGSNNATGEKNSEKPIKLLMNLHAPSKHHLNENGAEPWAQKVEKETNGRLEVEVHPNASLGDSESIYEDTSGGVYDIGLVTNGYGYDTPIFPWTLSEIPFVYGDPVQSREIIEKITDKYGVEKLNEQNVKYLGTVAQDPYILTSTKPINSIDDVKGMNIITYGRTNDDLVKSWGASPVSIDHNEAYEALQRGTADAIFYTGASSVTGMQYYEVAPYFIQNLPLTGASMAIIINKDKYESLPEDLQKTLDELGNELGEMMTESYQNEYEKYPEKIEDIEGVEITDISENDLSDFEENAKHSTEVWVKAANEKGYPGEEMLDYLIKLFEEEGEDVDFLK